jgi:hypothetical protein
MQPPLEKHLNDVAGRMGGFLRGFRDPRVHLGSTERFAAQFRILMECPLFHSSAASRTVSFAEAAGSFRVPASDPAAAEPATPASALIQGLREAESFAPENAGELIPARLLDDVSALLRVPALVFYLQFSDRALFFATLGDVASRNGFRLAKSSGSQMICPTCGSPLIRGGSPPAARCNSCSRSVETVMPLPMVHGAVASVSYEMLRHAVAMNVVETYQEESEIRPMVFSGGAR